MNFIQAELSVYLQIFWQFSWPEWIIFSLMANILLYLFSIGLYVFIEKTCRKSQLKKKNILLQDPIFILVCLLQHIYLLSTKFCIENIKNMFLSLFVLYPFETIGF